MANNYHLWTVLILIILISLDGIKRERQHILYPNKIYDHIVISFEIINAFVYLFEYLINDVNVFEN